MKTKNQFPQGSFRKLILHFNIDKTIVMRDSLTYNNTDFMIRQILSELIWGKPEISKTGEEVFKVEHKTLEFDKNNVDPELITYQSFLEDKFKPLTEAEYVQLENPGKSFEEMNAERKSQKIKALCEIMEPGNPGVKFKRMFEDMRKKLRVDEKIQIDLGLKLDNSKLDEKTLNEKQSPKFNELGAEYDKKDKFRMIFKNSYHNIIISFFNMLIALKKNKQDFAVVFRFFGQDQSDIEEFIYEFNCFCDCQHPRYCGDYGFNKFKYDVEKEKKDYRINLETCEYMGVMYRGDTEEKEKLICGSINHPPYDKIEEQREEIEQFYQINETQTVSKGYNEIYLDLLDKLTQNCSFVIVDDYSYSKSHNDKHGKLFLIDPYDSETLQIFFDTDTDENPEKIDIIDVITKQKIPRERVLGTFLVNVEPYRAILDINYFNNKIEECVNNRKNELLRMQGKEVPPVKEEDYSYIEKAIKKVPNVNYLQMSVFPLLHNALTMCEKLRPENPTAFIANFMLTNKNTAKPIEEIVKEIPKEEFNLEEGNKGEEEQQEENGEEGEMKEQKEGENVEEVTEQK
jgi:hypothetical protein